MTSVETNRISIVNIKKTKNDLKCSEEEKKFFYMFLDW